MTPAEPRPGRRVDPARQVQAWVLAVGGPALLVGLLLPARGSGLLGIVLMLLLAITLLAVTLGGLPPAALTAGLGLMLVAVFLLPPFGSPLVERPSDLLALVGFVAVTGWAIRIVDRATTARQAGLSGTDPSGTDPSGTDPSADGPV